MPITVNDLQNLIYDPVKMQQLILSHTGSNSINDPTNPFVMLVESATVLSSAAAVETMSNLQKTYPSLATSEDDIYHHISDKELINIFSTPAETNLVFYLNIRDIKSNANYNNTLKFYETYIQSGTEIMVAGIPFTLLNDIHIKLYDTGAVFAEQITNNTYLANNSLGILPAGIISFQDGEPWLAIETTVKQLKLNTISKPVTTSEGFNITIKHTDSYHYSEVFYKNNATNGNWVSMGVSHSSEVINPDTPTMYISVLNGSVKYMLPDVYLLSGQVSGEIRIDLYETQGYLDLPIYKYQMAEYDVRLNTITSDPVKSTISNIAVYANSRDILNGGRDGYTFSELRQSVINNTLGHTTLPITTAQLARAASLYGFELFNILDLVTHRTFAASKNMDRYSSKLVYTKPDIFFNTVGVNISMLNDNANIIVSPTPNNADYVVIPSNTVFKEVNGIIKIVNDTELAMINGLSDVDIINYTNNNKLFFTPYYYILDTTTTAATDARVYDLDTPMLKDIRITGKNINTVERCNIGKYGLTKEPNGYILTIEVLSNAEFKATSTGLLRGQLTLPLFSGEELGHIDGVYDPATEMMKFSINTNFNLTTADQIELTNAIANISRPLTGLTNRSTIYLYTEDPSVNDNSNYLANAIVIPHASTITVLDGEDITIEFGRSVDFIWNKSFITYTNRKYQKQLADKPLVYKEDVYSVDPITGSAIQVVTDPITGTVSTTKTLLHAMGDPVLDTNGNPLYEYKKGDLVLDANGMPAIDTYSGIVRNTDILMIEYVFALANTTVYKNYLGIIKDTIKGWLFNNLKDINSKVLENTQVLYRSYKTAAPITISTESVNAVVSYSVKPVVIVYSTKPTYTIIELTNLKTEIGYLLHKHLDTSNINISRLKDDIITNVDSSIVSVKVENIDTYRNGEVFSIVDTTKRLTPNKILELNDSGELEVVYDIDLRVHRI